MKCHHCVEGYVQDSGFTVCNHCHDSGGIAEEEDRGARCPDCFWPIYRNGFCRHPPRCPNNGKSVADPVFLTNNEAAERINRQLGATR